MSYFLTDPENKNNSVFDNHKSITLRGSAYWKWRDCVTKELTAYGMPFRVAEVAVIDLKNILYPCHHAKLTPFQTARMMVDRASELYKNKNGTWHYM